MPGRSVVVADAIDEDGELGFVGGSEVVDAEIARLEKAGVVQTPAP